MSDNIKVVVKVRPLISREIEEKLSLQWRVKNNSLYQLDQNGKEIGACFTFDKVYQSDTKTLEVYNDIAKPIVEAAVAGFNGTIFAYGQTSSGKTYTMSGTDESPGIVPLAVINLFRIIKTIPDRDFLVRVSFIEIYNETLKDLLDVEKKLIKIHDTLQGVKVDATERVTGSPEEVLEAMKQGEANRQTGATNMNEESSRSHSIFQITIESREHIEGEEEVGCVNVSQLNLVDLAGSERSGQTGATGIRFKEGTHINKSLSSLALVIKQLSEDPNKFANYRDSKLTRILQNSLGGNAKTSIICAITPASVEETISTLQFANRAKAIKNKPEVNAVATNATMIQSLTKQLSKLQSQLESKKNLEVMLETKKHVEQDNVNLQKQIAALQKLILNGFGQTSSMEMMDLNRRRPQAPRRMTISTIPSLQPIEEDCTPSIPRFCTPSLKYNPMSISTEFLPIHSVNKLPSVSEEPPRLTTPPPRDVNKVSVDEQIIEIADSDDDDAKELQPCSPYHKCYGSSKTPPCVLRINAKIAEKNLQDIVELTEREKIFTPSVVEVMEELDHNRNVMTKLQEEVNNLTIQSKEKDDIVDELRNRINQTEGLVKTVTSAKLDLEARCKDFETKLTDCEVMHETLKKKAKIREEELLSLLDEQQKIAKKTKVIGKPLSRSPDRELSNFLSLSGDISLVNSDNERSTSNINDDDSSVQVKELITDLQTQLTTKTNTVAELEVNVIAQNQKINTLEDSIQELHGTIKNLKNKLSFMDEENQFLKSTMDTLNCTIEKQKSNLENANTDIQSYNGIIQELQLKLNKQQSSICLNINEHVLEEMISNEEKFIANNENMKNLINIFKLTLESRNKEIENLKSTIQSNTELSKDNVTLKERLENKEEQLNTLIGQVGMLESQLKENVTVINKLTSVNQELNDKLSDIHEQNDLLRQQKEDTASQVDNLRADTEKLSLIIAEKELINKNITNQNEDLINKISNLSCKITELENDVSKDNAITAHLNEHQNVKNYIVKVKSAVTKLQSILYILNGNTQEFPDANDDFELILNNLIDCLNTLEVSVDHVIKEKTLTTQNTIQLKEEVSSLIQKHQNELSTLQLQIHNLNEERSNTTIQNENLLLQITKLTEKFDKISHELDVKNQEILQVETKLNDAEENNENLQNHLLSKENIVSCLQTDVSALFLEVHTLSQEKHQINDDYKTQIMELKTILQTSQESFDQTLREKNDEISELNRKINDMDITLEDKQIKDLTAMVSKFNNAIESKSLLLDNISKSVHKLAHEINIDNSELEVKDDVYEQIIPMLDEMAKYVTIIKNENEIRHRDIEEILFKTKQEIKELTKFNYKLMNESSILDGKNQELLSEIQDIRNINRKLFGTSELMNQLKIELSIKANEIEDMKTKAKKWKDQFVKLECLMKQQKEELQVKNEALKKCILQKTKLKRNSLSFPDLSTSDTHPDSAIRKSLCEFIEEIEQKSPQSLLTICCNKIIDALRPNETDSKSSVTTTSSKSNLELCNMETQASICDCVKLSFDFENEKRENDKLRSALNNLESMNIFLIKEREEVRKEVKLLLEPANELQKKIANHRTNLSTLTATTYAENKLLNSQLKVLKHHHTRYIHVCQRDIPEVKTHLHELMGILKGNSSFTDDKQNSGFKRYSLPDVLENNSPNSNFKNESTLDGDLLMLDTNVTLTTSTDTTLIGPDETSLDVTQINFDNEVACQTSMSREIDSCLVYSQLEILTKDNQEMFDKLELLKEENGILKAQVDKYSICPDSSVDRIDAEISPIQINRCLNDSLRTVSTDESVSKNCHHVEEFKVAREKFVDEINVLSQKLSDIQTEKHDIENKYFTLSLEVPATDTLVKKLSLLEKELVKKSDHLNQKCKEIKALQEENDTLSTQIMDNISEADELKKELDNVRQTNAELQTKCDALQFLSGETVLNTNNLKSCSQCLLKDEVMNSFRSGQSPEPHSKLNRSLSDSESSSRYNKICTLLNELHESKEDCKKITEEVATIKIHPERSNLNMSGPMDLDSSIGESNNFTFTKDFDICGIPVSKFNLSHVPEEGSADIYALDKIECLNFYVDMTGAEKKNINSNVKIIDILKMFHENLVAKHGSEVENLLNKLKLFEESKYQLQEQIDIVTTQNNEITKRMEEHDMNTKIVSNILSQIRNNTNDLSQEIYNAVDMDKNSKLVTMFKENLLGVLDTQFNLSTINIFEALIDNIVNKHQNDLSGIMDRYTKLQVHMESVVGELNTVNDNLNQMKCQLSDKEKEYNLLKVQKEKVHEISNAVTLDIIKKEQELCETITKGCERLLEFNIIGAGDVDLRLPLNKNVKLLFDRLINQLQSQNNSKVETENENLILEVKKSKTEIDEKKKELDMLRTDLLETENQLKTQKSLHDDLNNMYESKIEENKAYIITIDNLYKEISVLKESIVNKETFIQTLESELNTKYQSLVSKNEVKNTELVQRIDCLQKEIESFKFVNQMITTEKETLAAALEKSAETIEQNKLELDKMTSDILVLREAIKDNVTVIDSLKQDAKSLLKQNVQIKEQFELKCLEYSRLETNIKTHEKTAEIQSRMIIRLQKQKQEDDKVISEKDKLFEELTDKCLALQKECEMLKLDIKMSRESMNEIEKANECLKARLSELEADVENSQRHQPSIEEFTDNSRRRRQSIHDSKRMFAEEKVDFEDQNKMDAVFEARAKPNDFFAMDVDEDFSNRSSPLHLSRRRDSFVSRPDSSDKEDEQPSRPSSVMATRRRRQSLHDMHRSVLRHTPSPHDHASTSLVSALNKLKSETQNCSGNDIEVSDLRERLASCQKELYDLKEQYRELDNECETCAEYLREREEQCFRLKTEKTALEHQVSELEDKLAAKLDKCQSEYKSKLVHASVNTDEDWANLHSVVVDRMSFDAEVEKNKRLIKTIEELRYKKQELKNTLAKMQKALDKYTSNKENRELEVTKSELKACKQELSELKERYKELDDECETCAEYLKERDEQCSKLIEAKAALEAKLEELQDHASTMAQAVRKKRQSLHDQNRGPPPDLVDATTETTEDLLSYQVERDNSSHQFTDTAQRQIEHWKTVYEKVSREKVALEHRLMAAASTRAMPPTMFVATGSAIVQNQQISDVLKENNKLKKINAKLIHLCKKRDKNKDNETEQG